MTRRRPIGRWQPTPALRPAVTRDQHFERALARDRQLQSRLRTGRRYLRISNSACALGLALSIGVVLTGEPLGALALILFLFTLLVLAATQTAIRLASAEADEGLVELAHANV